MEREGRIFCIGRNYVKHVEELNNERPLTPVVFMKPASCIVEPGKNIIFPGHGSDMHHELELVLRIGKEGKARTEEEAPGFIESYTLGLDLTLRDVQQKLKEKGLPWEKAKAFDYSAPLGTFKVIDNLRDLKNFDFQLKVNGVVKQKGNTGLMIFPFEKLIVELSKIWSLRTGDIIYTGTPEGVAALSVGDRLEVFGAGLGPFTWEVVE